MPPKTNTADLMKQIGKKAIWSVNGLKVEVTIKDIEVFYGMLYYMISPVAGTGLTRVRDNISIAINENENDR